MHSRHKKFLTKLSSVLVILCLLGTLEACVPTTFGIPTTQWNALSPDQKQIVMNNYYTQQQQRDAEQARIDQINAQNAPLNNAIAGIVAALPEKTRTTSQSQTTGSSHCSGDTCQMSSETSGSSLSVSSPF